MAQVQKYIRAFLMALSIAAATSFPPPPAWGQQAQKAEKQDQSPIKSAARDLRGAWLQRERRNLEQRLAQKRQRESNIEDTILRALDVQARARAGNVAEAEKIAGQAVETARAALAKAKAARERDEANLYALDKAIQINQECVDFRARAETDREALRRQVGASELISEASEGQAAAVKARALMAGAKLAKLLAQFDEVTRTLVEAAEIATRVPSSADLPVLPAANPENLLTGWRALRAAHFADECTDHVRRAISDAALLERGLAFGQCAKAFHAVLEFVQIHGAAIEQLGRGLHIAVAAVDLANEIRELHEDLEGVATYTHSYPKAALEAAKRLDEAQKATFQQILECENRFAEVMRGVR